MNRGVRDDDPTSGSDTRSGWPILTALGLAGLYLAAGWLLLGPGEHWSVLALAASGLTILGVAGWLHRWVGRNPFDPTVFRTLPAAVILLLGVEFATFGAGIAAVVAAHVRSESVALGPSIDLGRLGVTTIVLVLGSLTVRGARSAQEGDDDRSRGRYLRATLALGAGALVGQVGEIAHGIASIDSVALRAGSVAFVGLATLHSLHVFGSLVALAVVLARTPARESRRPRGDLLAVTLFWHAGVALRIVFAVVLSLGTITSTG